MKDILLVLPEIVLLSLAALILIVDLFVTRGQKWFTYACGIGALLWTAVFACTTVGVPVEFAFSGLVVIDGVSTVLKLRFFCRLQSRWPIRGITSKSTTSTTANSSHWFCSARSE